MARLLNFLDHTVVYIYNPIHQILDDLKHLVSEVTQSTAFANVDPYNIIDGKIYNSSVFSEYSKYCMHTDHHQNEWLKLHFKKRVVIVFIHFFNRVNIKFSYRSNNLVMKALLDNADQEQTETFCANTGIMNNVRDKIFRCEKPDTLADEFLVINNKGDIEPLNICELNIYGFEL